MTKVFPQMLRAVGSILAAITALVLTSKPLGLEVSPTDMATLEIYLVRLIGAFLTAFLSVGLVYLATAPLMAREQTRSGPVSTLNPEQDQTRGRLAWLVLGLGGGAIAFVATLVVVGITLFSLLRPDSDPAAMVIRGKYDTLVFGIFNAVLPVLATWVGTVLAFYFGSENFRQAAQSTRDVLSDRMPSKRSLTDLMVPYERIARIETEKMAAPDIRMQDVISKMSEAATRVILFDKTTQTPIYIIRGSVPPMPKEWITNDYQASTDLPGNCAVSGYLAANDGANKVDAEKFCFIEASATPESALAKMGKEKVDDLFVTADGQPGSRALGWTTRYTLRMTPT